MQKKWSTIAYSLGLVIAIDLLLMTLASIMTGGIVSTRWTIFIAQWLLLAAVTVLVLLLKWVGIIVIRSNIGFTYLAFANVANALLGLFVLAGSGSIIGGANNYILLGITAVLGILLLIATL
jgi:hypothetical protein